MFCFSCFFFKTCFFQERDFDKHSEYCSKEPLMEQFLADSFEIHDFFEVCFIRFIANVKWATLSKFLYNCRERPICKFAILANIQVFVYWPICRYIDNLPIYRHCRCIGILPKYRQCSEISTFCRSIGSLPVYRFLLYKLCYYNWFLGFYLLISKYNTT